MLSKLLNLTKTALVWVKVNLQGGYYLGTAGRLIMAEEKDGGASRSLAHCQQIIVLPGRSLTNVLLVHDTQNPAPVPLKQSWQSFQQQPSAINGLH